MNKGKAFTLVELLVVIAILSILALIALPNFQQAMVRSKVATVFNDHRILAGALEAYFTDNNAYPEDFAEFRIIGERGLGRLTTPVAYISMYPLDAFGGYQEAQQGRIIITYTLGTEPDDRPSRWMLTSPGPNKIDETSPVFEYPGFSPDIFDNPASGFTYMRYDPTNGVVSAGDIIRVSDAGVEPVN